MEHAVDPGREDHQELGLGREEKPRHKQFIFCNLGVFFFFPVPNAGVLVRKPQQGYAATWPKNWVWGR
jgi:hypothetical protein